MEELQIRPSIKSGRRYTKIRHQRFGGGKTVALFLVFLILVGVAGIAYDLIRVKQAAEQLKVVDVGVGSVDLSGFPVPTRIDLDIRLKIRNPVDYTIAVDKLTYDIYINNRFVGQGAKQNLVIYGNGESVIAMPVSITSADAIAAIIEVLKTGTIQVMVRGTIEAPVRWFGIIRVFTVTAPYQFTKNVHISQLIKGGPPVEVVDARFEPNTVYAGQSVNVIVELSSSYQQTVNVEVVIKKDIALGFDEVAYRYATMVSFPGRKMISFAWIPPEPSSGRLRGYHIEVLVDGDKIYSMPSSYPPRLKVIETYTPPTTTMSTTYSPTPSTPSGMIQVIDAYWSRNGRKVSTVYKGDVVNAVVKLYCVNAPVQGQLTIYVKKDRVALPDTVFASKTFVINLMAGETKTYSLSFAPDQPSSSILRGYHIEVWFNNKKIYTMPSSYPPRLKVIERQTLTTTTTQRPTGIISISGVYWLVNGKKASTAKLGDSVKACVEVIAQGGAATATVTIDVRKDLAFRPDQSLLKKTFTVSLNPGERKTLCVTFTAQEKSGLLFRGYFIEVKINGVKVYTMPSSYPPRLKVS